jgi:hypothetical protein
MMKTAGYGFSILTAMTLISVSFICYAFVDDTDVVHVGRDVDVTGKEILVQMQEVVDHWEGGLKATGGALVPAKSYWYLIDFIWDGKKWAYATKEDVPGDISIRTVDGASRVDLTRHEVDHAEETLGIYLAMDGNNTEECAALRTMRKKPLAFTLLWTAITRKNARPFGKRPMNLRIAFAQVSYPETMQW